MCILLGVLVTSKLSEIHLRSVHIIIVCTCTSIKKQDAILHLLKIPPFNAGKVK